MNNLSFYRWFNLREADDYSPDVKNALDSIRIKRNIIEPNPNFIKQLFEYYNKNF